MNGGDWLTAAEGVSGCLSCTIFYRHPSFCHPGPEQTQISIVATRAHEDDDDDESDVAVAVGGGPRPCRWISLTAVATAIVPAAVVVGGVG